MIGPMSFGLMNVTCTLVTVGELSGLQGRWMRHGMMDCGVGLTFKQSSIWIMVWTCIMQGYKGPLVVLDYPGGRGRGMTADRYQTLVLEAKVQ